MTEDFFNSYVTCALWSSTDDYGDFLDRAYDEDDIAPEALASMREDCECFCQDNADALKQAGDDSQNGHDFWLTRNHHGAGFWDRGYGQIGERLTDAAHTWGSSDLYVGDDGKVYVS